VRAALFHGPGRPLTIEERAVPRPGSGEILVKVAACGVCHTDLHYLDHGVKTFKAPPLILGHEPSGTIVEAGPQAGSFRTGERVLLPAVLTCGVCRLCRLGRENICEAMKMFGNHVDGAYAEYVVAPAKDVFRLPDGVPLEEGSIIADALSTPFHAVTRRGEVRPGDLVAVFGCGGVGMNVVQIAAAAGGRVVAVDLSEEKLALARRFGAAEVVHPPSAGDAAKAVRRLTDGGADVAFEAIGLPATIRQALDSVRSGGRLVIVGYASEEVPIAAGRVMFREVTVLGSLGCRPVDYPPLIRMVADGRLKVKELVTHQFPLERINEAFDLLRRGQALRSIVLPGEKGGSDARS
jgi:6-hydroxycyclohex-1-ene-1-carbonyl-CoA dehydrogenase